MALIYVLIKQTFITKLEVEELSDQSLDRMYVEENVLTNTDRFLEGHMTGSLRAWHLLLIVSGGVMIAGTPNLRKVLIAD